MKPVLEELFIKIKEGIRDNNAVCLNGITEETMMEGLVDLFQNGGVNNIVEYFRKYRRLQSTVDFPLSCLLLETELEENKDPLYVDYQPVFKTKGHFLKVLCMMFDRSETFIFTGGEDGIIKIWDVYSGRLVNSLRHHCAPIFDFVVDFSNRFFMSCDQSGTIVCWDLKTLRKVDAINIGEQIDYLDVVYAPTEAEPLEQKKSKAAVCRTGSIMQAIVVTNSGRILRVIVGSSEMKVETILDQVEEGTFNEAATTRGKKMVVITGMWPFSVLLDVNDPDNRFYILDTEDMLSSSVDVSHNSLQFAISTYSSTMMIWKYDITQKPTKSNISTRKRVKGRDLEGCWVKSTIEIKGMGESIYNTDIVYLIDDTTLVAVDTESNIRLINTETKEIIMIEKEYKITGVVSHPTKNIFLTVEVNGVIKVIDSLGQVLNRIDTKVSVAGTVVMDSTGSFFYIADLDGAMYKYSILKDHLDVPESEFMLEDFDHYRTYNNEQLKYLASVEGQSQDESTGRVYEERNAALERIMKNIKGRESADQCTYTLAGDSLPVKIQIETITEHILPVDKWMRSIEVSGILQLQPEMITCQVFEKEFRRPSQTIIVPETEDEPSLSAENEDSSSNWPVEISDTNYLNTDDEIIETDNAENTSSLSSLENSSDVIYEGTDESTGNSESSESEENSMEESESQEVRTLSRKRGRRQAARKAFCPDINRLYNWYMSDTPTPPLLPQINDEIVLIKNRVSDTRLKENLEDLEPIKILGVQYRKTELTVDFLIERTRKKDFLVYTIDHLDCSPFILKHQLSDIRSSKYRRNEEIYYYTEGILSKGSVVRKRGDKIEVVTDSAEYTVDIYDVYIPATNYSVDLTTYIAPFKAIKDDHYIFYTEVSKSDYPDYYEIVQRPMTVNKIIRRLRNNYYRAKEELESDIETILSNCREYNEDDSEITHQCKDLIRTLLHIIEP
ncbi:uncharacterized protein NESG_00368 [Nematocida ausubeli]|uniref:Bromo domain-containing protein n=1 Tax=Nematocida ausubeli (strain ATCC PRA-371 / ERTm2) TaxID=1913371 RepID=A0A086J572_NEMA1|nr:uncharacterized protein NESG_00368 [Nematocida ausubeli]KFG27290.1 hypothetical protein NESG_00368 [Nematocida ausubeli]